jgi:hypothetical protein
MLSLAPMPPTYLGSEGTEVISGSWHLMVLVVDSITEHAYPPTETWLSAELAEKPTPPISIIEPAAVFKVL